MTRAPRHGWVLVRDALVVAVIALVVFQSLRKFVGDYYRVPSGSMEPILHGNEQNGDVVYVDAWSSAADCRRGDVAVVQHPEDPNGQLVKRIAARGDDEDACWITIRNGDIWLGGDKQRMALEVKSPRTARGRRALWATWPGNAESVLPLALAAGDPSTGELVLPALGLDEDALRALCRDRKEPRAQDGSPLPAGFVGCKDAVDATYLTIERRRGREGEGVQVFDASMELHVDGPVDALVALLETRGETITFLWRPAAGRLELWRNGVDVATRELSVRPTAAHCVEFGRLDNRLFFVVDGRDDATECFDRPSEWDRARGTLPRGPRTRLFVAAHGKQDLVLDSVHVFRDVYHVRPHSLGVPGRARKWPVHVRPGHWFLLGDNGFDSRDSRQFKDEQGKGGVPADSFLGRPRFVLGPWARRRWLLP